MSSFRIRHTMLRVNDLQRSLHFYLQKLGMKLFRREDYPEGRYTLAFVGYGDELLDPAIELTHNWDQHSYEHGSGYGHIALAVGDLVSVCSNLASLGVRIVRSPGPTQATSPDRSIPEFIAFIEDPDGYRIELIETA